MCLPLEDPFTPQSSAEVPNVHSDGHLDPSSGSSTIPEATTIHPFVSKAPITCNNNGCSAGC